MQFLRYELNSSFKYNSAKFSWTDGGRVTRGIQHGENAACRISVDTAQEPSAHVGREGRSTHNCSLQ